MLPEMWTLLSELKAALFTPPEKLDRLKGLAELIENSIREDAPPTINEGGIIKTGHNSELDELVQISRDGKGWLARMEVREREATGPHNARRVRAKGHVPGVLPAVDSLG